ncbi:MAG: DUF4329 domain-containing protein [Rhodanobacter sp.]
MRAIIRRRFVNPTLCALLLASLVNPAFARPQSNLTPADSTSATTPVGTGVVTPNQRFCDPEDPEPCDPTPPINFPPTISWSTVPANGSWILPTDTITLGANASDSDGSIANVRFLVDHQNVAIDSASPYQATVSHLAAGTHTLSAVATDNLGVTAQPSDVTINVRNSVVKGNVDGVSSAELIRGWACSTYLPQSINVDLYLGGPYGTGVGIGRYLANKSNEAAVASACSVSGGNYRFEIPLTDAQRVQYGGKTIYIYGISPIGATNNLLAASGSFTVPLAVRDAQFSTQTLVTAMLPGQKKNVTVQMRNNGNYTWTAASNFRLGSQNPADNATWGVSRVNATTNVAPGQTGTFNFAITAPSTPGIYNFQWRMLQEGVAWFGDLTPNMAVKVLSGSISASPATCTIPNGSSTCTATLNWTSNSSTSEVWVSGLDGSFPQLFAHNQNGSQVATGITTQGSRFTLKSDGYVLDSVDVRGLPAPVVSTSMTIDYDELGRVIARRDSAGSVKASYEYDANGNVTKVTDGANNVTTMTYDALDQMDTSTDAAGHATAYQHDIAGRLIKVTDPRGHATGYLYDGFGQLWQQISPDTGTASFTYDVQGLPLSMTRADGVLTTYGYDALNRRVSISAGGLTQQATYDSCAHGLGRLCSTSDATGTTSYTYTPEGQIAGRGFSIAGTTYALGYSYDSVGRVATVSYPDGNKANYSYANGLVSGVTFTMGTTTSNLATGVLYRPGTQSTASWISSNGLTNTLDYDDDGRLTSIGVPGVQNLTFDYDAADRISKITNGIDGTLTQSFGYDAMSRLSSVASTASNESYQYDANGNRTSQVVNGVSTASAISATSNRLASFGGTAFGYDANGNTTSVAGAAMYHYDAFNRMDSAAGTNYYVNPEGQRLRKSGSGGTSYFAPDRSGAMLSEYAGGWIDYVWLNGRLVGRVAGGQLYAIHNDQVGRPEAVTNASKAIVWRAQNFAFNQKVVTSGITFNLGFPGQYYDAETSAWNNGYRDYKSESGRYLESDPIGLNGGVNTYAYVENNPLSYFDSLGLKPGDFYPTISAAAIEAIQEINPASIHENREYAGVIYSLWGGGYSYTSPNPGTPSASSPGYAPLLHFSVADYHTHAGCDNDYDNENFSPADKASSGESRLPSYLGTPSGSIKMYDPITHITTILVGGH